MDITQVDSKGGSNGNNANLKPTNGSSNNNEQSTYDRNLQSATQQKGFKEEDPRKLIPELCRHFYHLGWASGTGGGLSIRQNGRIYCAPSGVQKERIKPEDMFVLNEDAEVLERPQEAKLKCSECLSLFMVPFKLRNAGCCIHSHSINANLVTAFYSKRNFEFQRNKNILNSNGRQQKVEVITTTTTTTTTTTNGNKGSRHHYLGSHVEFRITNQEMIKGIKRGSSDQALQYNETLVVPIIDNVLHERDLAGAMHEAVSKYPLANAVLVRNHGVYVWGRNWMEAKSMAECYDYLFKLKLEAVKLGFDWMLDE